MSCGLQGNERRSLSSRTAFGMTVEGTGGGSVGSPNGGDKRPATTCVFLHE